MKLLMRITASGLPFVIIAGLLYAGFYIKPTPRGGEVGTPVFERGDRYFGFSNGGDGHLLIAGSDGKVIKSVDKGANWSVMKTGTRVGLQDVASWNKDLAIAVGDRSTIIRTESGGDVWGEVKLNATEGRRVKLIRAKTLPDGKAWVVGEGGAILSSNDFGKSWELRGANEDIAWNDISVVGDQVIVVGEFGKIKTSSDGGKAWVEMKSPVSTSLMSIAFRDSLNGVAVGLDGHVISTSNGGKSWATENSRTDKHLFAVMWDGDRWVAVGEKGVIILKGTGSDKWNVTQVSATDRGWYSAVNRLDDHYVLVGSQVTSVKRNTR